MHTVVTAITGMKDILRKDQAKADKFVAFTDQSGEPWESIPHCHLFHDPVRNAKIHKILIHKFVEGTTIWMDGNIALKEPAKDAIERLLGDSDMWVSQHPGRACIYEEVEPASMRDENGLDCALKAQRYREEGYPKDNGLYECNVIIRRDNERTRRFNEMWWAEVCSGTRRDQISFPYCLWKSDIKLASHEHNVRYGFFDYKVHNE